MSQFNREVYTEPQQSTKSKKADTAAFIKKTKLKLFVCYESVFQQLATTPITKMKIEDRVCCVL